LYTVRVAAESKQIFFLWPLNGKLPSDLPDIKEDIFLKPIYQYPSKLIQVIYKYLSFN